MALGGSDLSALGPHLLVFFVPHDAPSYLQSAGTLLCRHDAPLLDSEMSLVIRPQSVSAVGEPNFREQDSLVAQFNKPEESG